MEMCQFNMLYCSHSIAFQVLSKIFAAIVAWAQSRGIRLFWCLGNWIVLAKTLGEVLLVPFKTSLVPRPGSSSSRHMEDRFLTRPSP